MRSSTASHARALGALLAAALAAGCYNPSVKEGGFRCNGEYPVPFNCPDGYTCAQGLCVKPGTKVDAAADQIAETNADTHPDTAPDKPPVEAGVDPGPADMGSACYVPVASCTADTTKTCDPVCQTGCGCHEKCSANALGALTCNVPLTTRPRGLGETCNISSAGTAAQTDDCMPGLVCFADACGSRCYHFCKTDAECPLSTCTRDAGGGVKICDVQASTTCNPVKINGQSMGCPTDAQGCYLSATIGDRTVCDCPFDAGGTNTSCSISRDCFPGLACVGPVGSSVCRPVCSLAPGATDCGPLSTCSPLAGSKKFGYCN